MQSVNHTPLKGFAFINGMRLVRCITFITFFMTIFTSDLLAQASAKDIRGAAPVVILASEPSARLIVDSPLAEPLASGRVVIQYRTENLRIIPVFGEAALNISPRIGHLHITLDDAPWRWLDTSNEPLTLNGLPAGSHQIRIDLEGPTHKTVDSKTVSFIVPELIKSNTQ
ncbi:MAG: DUF6130 family protein [Ferruginibacter sp.]